MFPSGCLRGEGGRRRKEEKPAHSYTGDLVDFLSSQILCWVLVTGQKGAASCLSQFKTTSNPASHRYGGHKGAFSKDLACCETGNWLNSLSRAEHSLYFNAIEENILKMLKIKQKMGMAVKEQHNRLQDDRNSFWKTAFTKMIMNCKLCWPKHSACNLS